MPAPEPTWTDERIELLRRRFEEGQSCRKIAAEIGVSRNAVIGKLSRLNLRRQQRGNVQRQPRKKTPKRQRLRTTPRLQYEILKAVYATPAAIQDEPIHDGRRCSLFELDEQTCRWPISTPGFSDFSFCGNLPIEGLPYCAGHARLAYRPDSRQRAARG